MKKVLFYCVGIFALIAIGLFIAATVILKDPEFGGNPAEDRAELLHGSPHFHEGQFHNSLKQRDSDLMVNYEDWMGDQQRTPPAPFPQIKPQYLEPTAPGLRAVWYGHASVLVEIDGYRVFFDPMLSEYAFPVKAVAPQRMNPPPLQLENLPKVDAVVVSHDHYDHLDMKTIQHLHRQGATFFVGLGVGAHLQKWGVSKDKINEMDWGDQVELNGLRFNCTEARHYSGRKSLSQNTLWTSWVVQGPQHAVFHSGDSGYSPHFKKIGEQFPNIDLSLIKVGDYGLDMGWQDVHMVPENSVQAHQDIGAEVMLPIHWGVFALSNHDWNEPIERTVTAAEKNNAVLATPLLGESFEFGRLTRQPFWWRDL